MSARLPSWRSPAARAALVVAFAAAALLALAPAHAQERKRVERAADLPRFSYPVRGDLETLTRDDSAFRPFATAVRRDIDSVLAGYDIADKAIERQLLSTLAQLDLIEGRYEDALRRANRVRELQEKPADRLMSGLTTRAIVGARGKVGEAKSDAFRAEVGRRISEELAAMPFDVVQNDVKAAKASAELMSDAMVMGRVREQLQPMVAKNGSLSSDFAPSIVSARFALDYVLPLRSTLVQSYATYLSARAVDKPDIWAARAVVLEPGGSYAPATIAVWDSGVDTALFRDRLVVDASGKPALIAFDRFGDPASTELMPIPEGLRDRLPRMKSRMKGLSDLQSNVDSAEAIEVKQYLATLTADQYRPTVEEMRLAGSYAHGTHVAGIALEGNPYARLVVGRIEFQYTLRPDPCPSEELAGKQARNFAAYVDFFRRNGVRVVNMSWGMSVRGFERVLEQCGMGATPEERKSIARTYFDRARDALEKAIAGAPEILFVASAGNSNVDATFSEFVPSGLRLPNVLTVGAVDKAGDEAAFTSYGPTVAVHANGYQVESTIPGGQRVAQSGTSMSSPQVTNLAAKMLAVNPALSPPELIAIIRDTAERTPDGRRVLIHPASAVRAAASKSPPRASR